MYPLRPLAPPPAAIAAYLQGFAQLFPGLGFRPHVPDLTRPLLLDTMLNETDMVGGVRWVGCGWFRIAGSGEWQVCVCVWWWWRWGPQSTPNPAVYPACHSPTLTASSPALLPFCPQLPYRLRHPVGILTTQEHPLWTAQSSAKRVYAWQAALPACLCLPGTPSTWTLGSGFISPDYAARAVDRAVLALRGPEGTPTNLGVAAYPLDQRRQRKGEYGLEIE